MNHQQQQYEQIVESWKNCERCGLHKDRKNVVVGSGVIPCDLLLIGEAPGRSEDMLGHPFVGRSGLLLTKAIRAGARLSHRSMPTIFYTNTIACKPPMNRDPKSSEIWSCWPRLQQLFAIAKPRLTICVGKIAHENCSEIDNRGVYHVVHPAWIARQGGESSSEWLKYVRAWARIVLLLPKNKERKGSINVRNNRQRP